MTPLVDYRGQRTGRFRAVRIDAGSGGRDCGRRQRLGNAQAGRPAGRHRARATSRRCPEWRVRDTISLIGPERRSRLRRARAGDIGKRAAQRTWARLGYGGVDEQFSPNELLTYCKQAEDRGSPPSCVRSLQPVGAVAGAVRVRLVLHGRARRNHPASFGPASPHRATATIRRSSPRRRRPWRRCSRAASISGSEQAKHLTSTSSADYSAGSAGPARAARWSRSRSSTSSSPGKGSSIAARISRSKAPSSTPCRLRLRPSMWRPPVRSWPSHRQIHRRTHTVGASDEKAAHAAGAVRERRSRRR